MNLPNKITVTRIFMSIVLLIILIFPFNAIGVVFPKYLVAGKVMIDLKYFICGIIFVLAASTDFIDGYIARKNKMVTDFGKVMDAIADKMLVNGVLIVLAVNGYISVIIPVIIVIRDIAVDSIKMIVGQKKQAVAASKLGKAKTVFMLIGITFTFFYNLPFELINIRFAQLCILVATVLSVVSGLEYYFKSKNIILQEDEQIDL